MSKFITIVAILLYLSGYKNGLNEILFHNLVKYHYLYRPWSLMWAIFSMDYWLSLPCCSRGSSIDPKHDLNSYDYTYMQQNRREIERQTDFVYLVNQSSLFRLTSPLRSLRRLKLEMLAFLFRLFYLDQRLSRH